MTLKTREFKARIVTDFKARWLECCSIHVADKYTEALIRAFSCGKLDEVTDRIEGRIITIVEEEEWGKYDHYEKGHRDVVIFPELFKEIK